MKNYLGMLMAAGALTLVPLAASADSITFQGLTFTASPDSGGDPTAIDLSITGTPSGDWSTIEFLKAFSLKPLAGDVTAASIVGGGDAAGAAFQVFVDTNQSGNGFCQGNQNNGVCFLATNPIDVTPFPIDLSFDIDFTFAGAFNLNSVHLQIAWLENATDTDKTGSLLSQDIVVPGPIVGAGLPGLIFACGGLLALARRRHQRIA